MDGWQWAVQRQRDGNAMVTMEMDGTMATTQLQQLRRQWKAQWQRDGDHPEDRQLPGRVLHALAW